jgi:hypothetical protein
MHYVFLIFSMLFGAFLNRARGSNFNTLIPHDTISRLLSMSGFAAMNVFYFMPSTALDVAELFIGSTLLLWLWCAAGWDKYWSEEIGNTPGVSRITGLWQMVLRMTLIIPYYAFLVWFTGVPLWHFAFAGSFILLSLTYYVFGYLTLNSAVIRNAEWANGAIIAATSWAVGV